MAKEGDGERNPLMGPYLETLERNERLEIDNDKLRAILRLVQPFVGDAPTNVRAKIAEGIKNELYD